MTTRYVLSVKKGPQTPDVARFVWSADDVKAIFGATPAQKFNPNHKPAGTPDGGQFTTGDGSIDPDWSNFPDKSEPRIGARVEFLPSNNNMVFGRDVHDYEEGDYMGLSPKGYAKIKITDPHDQSRTEVIEVDPEDIRHALSELPYYKDKQKFNPNHVPAGSPEGGQFAEGPSEGASFTDADNRPEPGKPFLVFRVGAKDDTDLVGKNAANARGIAEVLFTSDPVDADVHVFEVSTDKKLGKYAAFNKGKTDDKDVAGIGNRYTLGFGGSREKATDLFSFGTKGGFDAKHLGSFPVKSLYKWLKDNHPVDDASDAFYNWNMEQTHSALQAVVGERIQSKKFNPNHYAAGTEGGKGGQFAPAEHPGGTIIVTDRLGNEVEVAEGSSLANFLVKDKDGNYRLSPERELLHQQIINDFLKGVKHTDGPVELYMTGGGPASGKSSVLVDGVLPAANEAVQVNPDLIKEKLPEWAVLRRAGNIQAGSIVHEESSMLAKRLGRAAVAANYNVVLDTTGDSDVSKLARNLEPYRKAGYKINAFYATLDTDLAVKLSNARGQKTGRFVPEEYLRESHANVSRTFPKAVQRGLFDSVKLYDTNIRGNPRLIAEGHGSKFTIHDKALYNSFLDKAEKKPRRTGRAMKADPKVMDTDDLSRMVVAITLGLDKKDFKPKLGKAGSALWDAMAESISKCPEGQFVDPGNENPSHDFTSLYAGPLKGDGEVGEIEKAEKAAEVTPNTQWVTIKRLDGDKQIVYGEVYAPYVLDTYGEFMTPEDIELMAHRFMKLDLNRVIDTQHDNQPNGSYPVESFIARDGDPHYTPGAWVLGVHVPDPSLWLAIKNGQLNGFSFQCLVKPTDVDVEINAIRDFVGETELQDGHSHVFFVELNDIGNVVGGRTSKAADGHYHEINYASVTARTGNHSHRFFL